MKRQRLILIRHGESEANIDKSVHAKKPDYTVEFTSQGIKQPDTAGGELKTLLSRWV